MAPPPLSPLSCVAGSLALSFTDAAQPEPAPRADPQEVVPAPPPAAPAAPVTPQPTPPAEAAPPVQPAAPARVVSTWPAAPPVVPARTHLLRPTEKRYFFSLFVGGGKTLLGYSGYGMDFKLEGAIGGHGRQRRTLAGAAVVQARVGSFFSSFTLAPRLQWDKQIVPDHAIYLTTTLTAGYRVTTYGDAGIIGLLYGYHGGMAAVGWGVSAIVADRLLLSFRPVNPELEFNGGTGFSINWDVFGGIGVVW